MYNSPISDILAIVPVTVAYGDIINYADGVGTVPTFICSYQPQLLQIQITDQDGNEPTNFTDFPWYATLELIEF